MPASELNKRNYRRITRINFLLSGPLILLFGWPYFVLSNFLTINEFLVYVGTVFFSVPFTITVLNGHIALAMGEIHRYHYYEWQRNNPVPLKIIYHPIIFSKSIRLVLIGISLIILLTGFAS